jgi:DNA-directed RNA polymerase specialized sigma24 family protein
MTNSEAIKSTPPPEDLPEDSLDTAIKEILGKGNPHSYSTITTIKRFLLQFHLASRFEAYDILNEAYIRGREYIRSGGVISNPHSWLKGTCFNIIREISRKQNKEQLLAPEFVEFVPALRAIEDYLVAERDMNSNLRILFKSLETLKKSDPGGFKLVYLQGIEGLSWKEIRDRLIQEGEKAQSELVLRQKGCRAKKNLRKIYHSMV